MSSDVLGEVSFCPRHRAGVYAYKSYKKASNRFRKAFWDVDLEKQEFTLYCEARKIQEQMNKVPGYLQIQWPVYITREECKSLISCGLDAVAKRRTFTKMYIYRGTDDGHAHEEEKYLRQCKMLQTMEHSGQVFSCTHVKEEWLAGLSAAFVKTTRSKAVRIIRRSKKYYRWKRCGFDCEEEWLDVDDEVQDILFEIAVKNTLDFLTILPKQVHPLIRQYHMDPWGCGENEFMDTVYRHMKTTDAWISFLGL